jgi:hypothetical protein
LPESRGLFCWGFLCKNLTFHPPIFLQKIMNAANPDRKNTCDPILIGSGISGPSMLFMALTARAAHFTADEMKTGNL